LIDPYIQIYCLLPATFNAKRYESQAKSSKNLQSPFSEPISMTMLIERYKRLDEKWVTTTLERIELEGGVAIERQTFSVV